MTVFELWTSGVDPPTEPQPLPHNLKYLSITMFLFVHRLFVEREMNAVDNEYKKNISEESRGVN